MTATQAMRLNDFYHRYKEDIQLLKNLGVRTFRSVHLLVPRLPDGPRFR